MSLVLQDILVGVLVAGCALFSVWRLATVPVRLRLLQLLHGLPVLGRAAWMARLRQRTLEASTAACGGCSQADAAERRRKSGGPSGVPTPGAASQNRTRGALRR